MRTAAMTQDDRDRWNPRFADGSHAGELPDGFFVDTYQEYVQPLLGSGGDQMQVLDVAAGAGRHGLWLAERGWRVTMVDVAEEGLAIARRRARGRNLDVDFQQSDLEQQNAARAEWHESFHLVLCFFYLQRDLFPALADAVKPGGLVIYKTYTEEQRRFSGGPTQSLHLLRPGELLSAFPGLRILSYRETVRDKGVAELVAWKEK